MANWWRARMSLPAYGYARQAERQPHRRRYLLWFWRAKRIAAKRLYAKWSKARDPVSVIQRVFGPAAGAAISVAACESHLNPRAVNSSSGAAGLFQLMPMWWEGRANPFDPVANTRIAYALYSRSGWAPWVCKP